MIKAGQKKKETSTEVVTRFFANPGTSILCEQLVAMNDEELRSFFKDFYSALDSLKNEAVKAAVGMGDPERVIKEAGTSAPTIVRKLGTRIASMAET